MVKSVRCLNGKMCPESFPAYLLDFEICFFVYLLDTYIFIHVHGYFCYLDQRMVKSVQFIKFIREIQTSPKSVLCIQGRFGLVYFTLNIFYHPKKWKFFVIWTKIMVKSVLFVFQRHCLSFSKIKV